MPTYVARCPKCGDEVDFVRRVAERDDTPVCKHDGSKTERILTATMIPQMGIADHYKIVSGSGQTFYGKHDYMKHLKANGLVPTSDIKGEAEYQAGENAKKAKAERRKQLGEIIRQHT